MGASADRPSSLGDLDRLSANSSLGGRERIIEQASSRPDTIRHTVLEVWVGVHAHPVTGIRNSRVGRVGPCSPGVNVANRGLAQRGVSNGGPDLLDIVDKVVWVGAVARLGRDTRRGDAVEILAANGDSDYEICELGAVLCDGGLEGGDFGLHASLATGSPQAQEEGGVLGNGSRDGGCGFVG